MNLAKRLNLSYSWTEFRIILLILGYLGVAHFAFGLYLTTLLAQASPGYRWHYFVFALPYTGIMLVFVSGLVLAHKRQPRWSALVLAFAFLVSAAMCAYDLSHLRYQISGTGHGPGYAIWWWYDDPYWKGYKPGNI